VSLFDVCGVAGGFIYQLISRIIANSNAYASHHKKNNRFGGSVWKPITVKEMYHFLGMTLKMSIDNRELGGMTAYFCPPNEMKYGQVVSFRFKDSPLGLLTSCLSIAVAEFVPPFIQRWGHQRLEITATNCGPLLSR
jgi:hypothetical protein